MSENVAEPRDRLLQAAIQEFALRGYDHGTVRNICGLANVNLNAVKYYFNDKQGLYVEAVKQAHRLRHRMFDPTWQSHAEEEQSHLSPEERLRQFIHDMVSMALAVKDRSDHCQLLIFREIANPSEATQHIVREFIGPHFQKLNNILNDLLPAQVAAVDRHLLAFSVVGQCMHYKVARPIIGMLIPPEEQHQFTEDRIAEHVTRVTLAALSQFRASESA